jgi:uncharacterized protein YuzB (UPF0349 family)
MRDRPQGRGHAGIRTRVALASLAVLMLTAAVFPARGNAQDYTPPRNEWGQPDLQGIWQVLDTSAHYNIEPHNASYGVPAGTGIITDPPDGRIPYNANGLAKRTENLANRATLDPIARCYKPGTPHIMYLPFPLQILQSENVTTINSEYVHNTRFIYLHRTDHYGEGDLDLWNGDSVGGYEGNALVTDVYNFHPDVWLDRAGNHAGGWTLGVEERFELVDADTLRYQATLEDPEDFTRPWTIEVLLYRHKDPDKRILEYECHAYADNALGPPELPVVP